MIEAQALCRQFGPLVAVDGVSLCVPDGTILALLGPNGAGKTTTVRLLTGLLRPSAGRATVDGLDVRAHPAAVRARVGLVTDVPGLHDQMTPLSYLSFFGHIYGLDADACRRRINELLDLFDLQGVAAKRMAGFSRGMQQKVALARALLHEPAALFLDEPTTGLDPLAARAVRNVILALKHQRRSIVLCTHDLHEADCLADRVVILRRGRVVASDAPAALRAKASQETLVRVTFATRCSEAVAIVARVAGVSHPALEPPAERGIPPLVYRTPQPERTNPTVIAGLVAAGAAVVSVTSATATLEDVYAQVQDAPGTSVLAGCGA